MEKKELPNWVYYNTGDIIDSISKMPDNVIGFVYRITFTEDRTMYVGKKDIYTTIHKQSLKSSKARPNAIDRVYKNTGKGFRLSYDVIKKESDWKTYFGSSKEAKIRTPSCREILQYAYSKRHLTYLEAKWLFQLEVLERTDYLNDNILGSFYRNVMLPEE